MRYLKQNPSSGGHRKTGKIPATRVATQKQRNMNVHMENDSRNPERSDSAAFREAFQPPIEECKYEEQQEHLLRVLERLERKFDRLVSKIDGFDSRSDLDELLDMDETAEHLGVSRRTVDTLIAEGAIPSLKIGRLRRVPSKALQACIRRKVDGEGRTDG